MKGLIFNEFLDFVEQTTSYDVVDKIILKSNLESGGAYTTIGTYNPSELYRLVAALSEEINVPQNKLIYMFGVHLFGIYVVKYPQFFVEKKSVFDFLSDVEDHIHFEVKKFYKDAKFPHFKCTKVSPEKFVMVYSSPRPLADLAEGVIQGCINYHKEDIKIIREDIPVTKGAKAKFTLIKRSL